MVEMFNSCFVAETKVDFQTFYFVACSLYVFWPCLLYVLFVSIVTLHWAFIYLFAQNFKQVRFVGGGVGGLKNIKMQKKNKPS